MLFHTIPDILSYANEAYGADDAIRMMQTALPMPSKSLAKKGSISL